jgi:outer membrane protein assembly factor BamB
MNRNRKIFLRSLLIANVLGLEASTDSNASYAADWPNWRGPQNTGVSSEAKPPIEWDAKKNIRWKAPLPGKGSSTPIVLGDKIFILTAEKTDRLKEGFTEEQALDFEKAGEARRQQAASGGDRGASSNGNGGNAERPNAEGPSASGPNGGQRRPPPPAPAYYYRFLALALDRNTGEVLWKTTVTEQVPHEAGHGTNNFASSSPTTDGKTLFVSFGSRGIYALDLNGKVLWQKDLGQMETRNEFGEGGSPALFGDTLVVPWDHEGQSFIAALDKANGNVRWKVDRDEKTGWSTPLIVEHKGRVQVITNGKKVRSYDLRDGSLIWEAGGQTDNPIPTPILNGDHVIAVTGFRGANAYAISLDAEGDVTENSKYVKWQHREGTPYVPSPTLYNNKLYFVKSNNAILSSIDANTGKVLIDQKRIEGIKLIYSSLGAAANRIYVTDRNGITVVLEDSPELKILATNSLEEEIDASPVFIGIDLFLRGDKHLYCIREQSAPSE